MKKTLVLLSMAAVVAVLVAGLAGAFGAADAPSVYASRLAGIQSAGVTGIQIQNLDQADPATIVADFYNQKGGAAIPINRPGVAPGSAANIFLPTESALQNGAYAAIISADRKIAAIARTDWNASGGAAIYSNVIPDTTVALPLAVKQYVGQTSLVSIQNTDTGAQANVEVKLFQTGNSTAIKTVNFSIGPGTSITLDLDKNENFLDVPAGFLGSMTVTSATPIGVQSFVDIFTSEKAVYAFEGVPASAAADTLYAPLFRNNFFGTTGISVVNPGTSPVDVSVNYIGTLGDCAGLSFPQGPATIAAGSSAVFYQGNADVPGTGNSNLPDNCAGSAVVSATGGNVLAIVNDATGGGTPTTSAAYNAVSLEQGAMNVALPLFRNAHTGARLTTGIQAMNIGGGQADVTIVFKDSTGAEITGCGNDCQASLAPNASANWWPGTTAGVQDRTNIFGSASITSNEPLAVIVNDVSETGAIDSATYNGINAD